MPDVPLTASNFGALLVDVQTAIAALDLTSIPSANIVARKVPWDEGLDTPYVIVSPAQEEIGSGPAGYNDVEYRFVVTIATRSNRDPSERLGHELEWRESIRNRFHDRTDWSAVSCLILSVCEMGEAVIPEAFRVAIDAQYLVVRATVREVRP